VNASARVPIAEDIGDVIAPERSTPTTFRASTANSSPAWDLLGDGNGEHHGMCGRGAGNHGAGRRFAAGRTADRIRIAERTGATAVAMIKAGLTPNRILTAKAFENALRVLLAIGGSTNAIIHLTAIAGRVGIQIELDALDALGRDTPVLVDLKPSGRHYMEDFHSAGGVPALLRELRPCSTSMHSL
jgi:hypothetical protein